MFLLVLTWPSVSLFHSESAQSNVLPLCLLLGICYILSKLVFVIFVMYSFCI
jgi:hypothetical protein